MSDHKLYSAAETRNAEIIIDLAELLYEKGILKESDLARIFAPGFESHDFVGKFPLDLLPESAGFASKSPETIDANEQKIYDFMNKNSIPGQIISAISSIQFCRYEISVEPGTDVRIFSRMQDELCQLLKVKSIRIFYSEDDHVCLEVPHISKRRASIRQILEREEWENSKAEIPLAIGENVSGEPVILDLGKIRNLLIIGPVKNGGSTFFNSIILSLLHKFSPDELQLLMYAPKQEISRICRSLPHLSRPPMTTSKEVRETFEELFREIKRRRWIIAAAGADNLNEFNTLASVHKKMPRIVVIIDNFGRDKMDYRLTQIIRESYEVGIHLILGTTHSSNEFTPVVELFSALIQFFPTPIFHVGDMQVRTSRNKCLKNVHAALTANCDMRKVVKFISESVPPVHDIDTGCCKKPKWEHLPNGHTVLTSLRNECFHDDTSLEIVIY